MHFEFWANVCFILKTKYDSIAMFLLLNLKNIAFIDEERGINIFVLLPNTLNSLLIYASIIGEYSSI